MHQGGPIVTSRPPAQTFSFKQIPDNQVVTTSTWAASSTSSARTMIVDDSDVAIAVMGATGSGKTTFINLASGSDLRVGRGLKSCTNIVQVAQPFELDGRTVTLIDTPGFDDTTKSDADILRMIAAFLATTYESGKKLAGVIYLHRISDFRMSGIATRNFKLFRELCGESTLKNVVILTNMWGEVSLEVGEARENELKTQDLFFKPVLEKGAQILRHDNTRETAHNILRHLTENLPMPLQIQREMVDQKKDISQTAAGAELNKELMLQIQKHKEEMKQIQEEMREAIRTKDEETRQELEAERKKLQEKMNKVQADAANLASVYEADKKKLDQRLAELNETNQREQKKAEEDHQRQLAALREQLDHCKSDASERAELLRQIEEHQRKRSGGFFANLGRAIDNLFGIH